MTEPIRPDVVDAIFNALSKMDPTALIPLASTGFTPEEKAAAEDLWAASLIASGPHRDRHLASWDVFIDAGVNLSRQPSWSEVFDLLQPEHVERLRDLYADLDDGARAEFDRRYGRPVL